MSHIPLPLFLQTPPAHSSKGRAGYSFLWVFALSRYSSYASTLHAFEELEPTNFRYGLHHLICRCSFPFLGPILNSIP
jgi:hypothetical protein